MATATGPAAALAPPTAAVGPPAPGVGLPPPAVGLPGPVLLTRPDREATADGPDGWGAVAAFGALAGGLLHGAAAVAHAGHGTGYVLGFAAAGGAQVVLAAVLRRRVGPVVLLLAVAGTVALIAGYVAGQLGLPEPGPHHRVPSWSADVRLAAVVADLVTVAALSAVLTGRWRAWSLNLVLVAGVVLWGWWLAGW